MKRFVFALLMLPSFVLAQTGPPYLVSPPCATGAPLPTACQWTLGGTAISQPPYTDANGKVRCAIGLSGRTGSLAWVLLPANVWGPATTNSSGTVDMSLLRVPDSFPSTGFAVVPALP